mmetsp:Transcript_56011/g.93113  ORF Transcript_56011/g.93113 Transcript_56011/m.93113 type:complete len:96 (+) Transcript_56011:97-384(+)
MERYPTQLSDKAYIHCPSRPVHGTTEPSQASHSAAFILLLPCDFPHPQLTLMIGSCNHIASKGHIKATQAALRLHHLTTHPAAAHLPYAHPSIFV